MANQIKYQVGFDVRQNDLNKLKASLQDLQKLKWSDLMKINDSDISSAKQALNDIRREAGNVQDALKQAFNTKLNTINIETFNQSLRNSGSSIQKIYQAFSNAGAVGQAAFRNLSTQILSTNIQLKESHNLLNKMAETLGNTIKWNVASAAVNSLSRSVEQAWGYAKSLDTSLNNIRVVTGKSADEMAKFAVQANNAAKELGKTTTDYTNASLIYAQQGLNDKEIAERAAITLKTANVTGQSTADVSEQLTAVWNGYKVNAQEAELYVDRLAAVAATTASDLEELSTGMSKVASAAAAMGVGEDQLAAQLSTIISVTRQAPESVGTALRTVYARISDIKAGLDEDGVTLGNYSEKMAGLGINVLDLNGHLRDMGAVMEEIGGKWNSMTRQQQVYLAQTMAGQRQYNNLLALFDNFQRYTDALNVAQNAAGTLQRQQDTYMESTAAHLRILKASVEDIYDNLIDTDDINKLIDGLSTVATLAADLVDGLGGGGAVLKDLGAIALVVFNNQIGSSIMTTINNFERARQQMEYFKNAIAQAQKMQQKGLGNNYTQFLIGQEESLLKIGDRLSIGDFNAIQQKLTKLSQTSGNIDIVKEKIELLKQGFNSLGIDLNSFTAEWGTLDDALASADGVETIKNALKNLENSFDPVINKQKQAREALKTFYRDIEKNSPNAENSFDNLKNKIQDLIGTLKTATISKGGVTLFNTLPENAKKAVDEASNELKKLDFSQINSQQASNKITEVFSTLSHTINNEINNIQLLIKDADSGELEGLKQKLESLHALQKQIEDEFNILKQKANQTIKVQDLTSVAGGIAQVGASIQQLQHLGSIFENKNLTDGQKLLQIITNLAISLPMLGTGFVKVTGALKLMNLEVKKSSAEAATAIMTENVHTASLGMLGVGASKAGVQIQFLNSVLKVSWLGLATTAVVGLAAAYGFLAEQAEQARKNAIQEADAEIEKENKIQEEIEAQKELYTSLEELNKKSKDGEISRGELKSAVEDLIEQYGLEGEAVKSLKDNYEDLTGAIRQLKKGDIEERIASVTREKDAAENKIVNEARGKGEYWSGQRVFGSNVDRISFNFGTTTNDEPEEIKEVLTKLGFSPYENGVYTGDYAKTFNPKNIEQIIELYHQIENAISDINQQVSAADRENSEYYLGMTAWLNTMSDAVEKYENAQKDLKEARIEQIGLNEDIDFSKVDNAINYYQKRQELVAQIFRKFKFQINSDEAFTLADNYIRKNFNDLYKNYSQIADYLANLRYNFKEFDEEVAEKLGQLSSEQLAFIESFEIGKELSGWQQLKDILEYMETADLSNLKVILDPDAAIEEATAQYDLYSSLAEQISSSDKQTIGKKEYEKLTPEVQEFFSLIANGQYKMTGDAKKFYDTVNNLSLEGFKQNIKDLEGSADRLKNLQNYQIFTGRAIKEEAAKDNDFTWINTQFDFLTEMGYNLNQIVKWKAQLQTGSKDKREELFFAVNDAVIDVRRNIIDLQATIDTYSEAVEKAIYSNQLAIARSADSFKILKEYLNDGIIGIQAYSQAAIQLDKVLDLEGLDTEELKDYSDYLQEIAVKSNELSDELLENSDAAEIVAKGIMKMNDAIDTLANNWEKWLDIFNNSSEMSKEYADAMDKARNTIADLLDISVSYVSSDFIREHLDEITEAATGSEAAIDGLKAALSEDIIARIILENGIDETMQGQILSDIASLQAIIPDLEIGATLEDNDFVTKAQELVDKCKLTVDQANAVFDSLGFETNFVTEPQEVEQRVPKTVTKTQVTGWTSGTAKTPLGLSIPWMYPVLSQSSYNDGFDIQKGVIDVPAMSTNGKSPVIKTMTKKATANFNNYSSKNTGGGAPGKSSSSGKSGSSKANEPDTSQKDYKKGLEDERDIYHDINIEIEQINRSLDRTQKKQDRLYGKNLLDNLNKQSSILQQHKQKLKEKNALQEWDLELQREALENLGVTFDSYGNISNYMSILASKQAQVNAKVQEYNDLISIYNAETDKETKKQIGEEAERLNKQIKEYEDEYKDLEKKIKNYDSLREDMEDLLDEIEEETQKQIEINIKKFNMELEIRLKLGEAERDWNKFRREVLEHTDILKDSDFSNIFSNALQGVRDITSYFNVHGSKGSLQVLIQQLADTRAEIEAINATGASAIYGDNKAQAMEDLQENLKELMGEMQDIEGLIDDIDEAYLDTVDDVEKQFDKQIEDYEYIEELIQHNIDLLSLLYGDRNYDAMDKYYSTLEKNNIKQLDLLRKQRDFWKDQWDAAIARGDTQAAKQFEENYKNTIKNLNEVIEESAKNIQNKYINAIEKIFNELDKKISNGKGTDYLNTQWDLMNKNANEYLDTINSAFAIQETQRKYQNALDETKSVKNQQTLKALMDQQLNILRTKEKITQYDVDRAEKLLQIEQARIALQDAQSAKTSMRLKRDAQGNYSYEYVSDNGAVGAAQANLAQVQNDLYNFDKERYQSNLNDILAAWKDFQSEYKDILEDTSFSEEERVERLALLREQYGEYINDKTAENIVIRNNLMESAFTDLALLYETDVENYNQMSSEEQNILMGDLVPAWKSGIQEMSDKVAGEGGFIPVCEEAFNSLTDATERYKNELGDMTKTAGIDLMDIKEGVDNLSYSFEILIEDNDELTKRMNDEIDIISSLKAEIHSLIEEYKAVYNAAKLAASGIHGFIQAEQGQAAAAAAIENGRSSTPGSGVNTLNSNSNGEINNSVGSGTKGTNGNGFAPSSDIVEGIAGNIWIYGTWGNDPDRYNNIIAKFGKIQGEKIYRAVQAKLNGGYGQSSSLEHDWEYYRKYNLFNFKSGGYTGDWIGNDGKLAFLHQKELILNPEDTKNLLSSVNIMRSVMSTLNGNMMTRLGDIKTGYAKIMTNSENGIEQNVHIEASFPNVDSKRQIEEAFNDLVNLAAQRAMKR